jgi:predicted MPP superfamily phosphohydrolase
MRQVAVTCAKWITALAGAAGALAGALAAWVHWIEPRWLEVREFDIGVQNWPSELNGLTMVLIADIHMGFQDGQPWKCPPFDKAVRAVEKIRPDVLIFGGDVGYGNWHPNDLASVLDRLKAPVRVATLGNHDYAHGMSDAKQLTQLLKERGYAVLIDETMPIEVRGKRVWFAGIPNGGRPYGSKPPALVREIENEPLIVVVHKPDDLDVITDKSFDLAVAGHTHGGQLAIPLLKTKLIRRFGRSKYDRGYYEIEGAPVVVTKGVGMVGYRGRLFSRPEVVSIRLRALA